MFKIFASSKKWELKPYTLLRTSSEMTTLLEIISFLKVMTIKLSFTNGPTIFSCLDARYLNNLVSISALINASNMLTHFGNFSGFPWPSFFDGKGTKGTNRVVCIETADIKSIYTKNTYAKSTDIKNIFFAKSIYIKHAIVRSACIKNIYIGDASAVEHLKMHLQSF